MLFYKRIINHVLSYIGKERFLTSFISSLGSFAKIAVVLAIIATVAAFLFIIPKNKREKLNLVGRVAHDIFNFKFLMLEKICQALYVFFTVFVIIAGFFMLFAAPEIYYGHRKWLGGYGLLLMILGPIVARMIFEYLMLQLLLVKNVISINNKLRAPDGQDGNGQFFGDNESISELWQQARSHIANRIQASSPNQSHSENANDTTPVQPTPSHGYCPACGSALNSEGKCSKCDPQ